MAVMNKMREHMAVILFIVLVLFLASMTIGGLVGGANIVDIIFGRNPNAVAEVNGKSIPFEQFYKNYQQEIINYRERTGREPEGFQLQNIEDQVFNSMIQNELVSQALKKKGIRASDGEILFEILNNPPQILRQQKVFQDSAGNFDMNKYREALNNPNADWRPVEDYLRAVLPYQKLQREILSSVRVTEEELRLEFMRRNLKAKVRYVFFDPRDYMDKVGQISEDEMRRYYNEHKEEFREPEKRKIKFVFFPKTPSAKDTADTYDFANQLLKRAKSGEDFAELAKTYSDDEGTAEKGGDLGFFAKGAMVKPFEEAAFKAKPGQVVGPVKTRYGLHIIKVEAKKREKGKELVHARHILLKFKPSVETVDAARSQAEYIAETAQKVGLEQAAAPESVKVEETPFFTEGGFIPQIGLNRRISNFVFHNAVGKVSDVYETNRGFYVVEVAAIQKERIRPFEDVKSQIENILKRQKAMALAGEACKQAYQKIKKGASLFDVVDDPSKVREPDPFTMAGPVPGLGMDRKFIGAAFALEPGEISPPVEGTKGWYLIELIDKDKFDEKAYQAARPQLYQQLLQRKRARAYSEWLAELKKNADIKDYRYYFFK